MTRSLVGITVVALVAAVAAMLVVVAAGWSPRVEYVIAVAIVGAFGAFALRRLLATVAATPWPSPRPPTREAPGVDPRIGTIETALRRGVQDAGICRRRVQPLLFDLATHRLRRHRGVSLVEEPDAARQLLGDEGFRFLTEVVDRPASVPTIARTVDAIERL